MNAPDDAQLSAECLALLASLRQPASTAELVGRATDVDAMVAVLATQDAPGGVLPVVPGPVEAPARGVTSASWGAVAAAVVLVVGGLGGLAFWRSHELRDRTKTTPMPSSVVGPTTITTTTITTTTITTTTTTITTTTDPQAMTPSGTVAAVGTNVGANRSVGGAGPVPPPDPPTPTAPSTPPSDPVPPSTQPTAPPTTRPSTQPAGSKPSHPTTPAGSKH